MSLKARLRVAVAILMSAMVLVLSVLYISGYLKISFTRTHETATSIADQLSSSVGDDLRNAAQAGESGSHRDSGVAQFLSADGGYQPRGTHFARADHCALGSCWGKYSSPTHPAKSA